MVDSDLPKINKTFVSFELFEHLHDPKIFLEILNNLMNSGDIKDIEDPKPKIGRRDIWFAAYAASHFDLKDLSSGYYFGKVKNLI